MSYINEALRKAQQERDGRYGLFAKAIAPLPEGRRPGRRRVLRGLTAPLAGGVAALLLALPVLNPDFLATRRDTPLPAAAPPPATEAVPPPAAPIPAAAEATVPSAEVGQWQRQALAAQRRGNLRQAESLYRRVLLADPERVEALNNLGVLYMQRKKRDAAIAMFSKAIVVKKDYVDPYYNLACLYAQSREIDEGLWYLKAAVTLHGEARAWAEKDGDLKVLVATDAFKKFMKEREK